MSDAVKVTGSLLEMIRNDGALYEGNLKHYFRVVWKHARNLMLPYHNFRHMLHVTWLCYEACGYYRQGLTSREMRNLLIAAMFHDFDHCGMFGEDDLNIERAIRALRKHICDQDRPFLPVIERFIRGTQYPHVIPSDELDLCGRILCDADISQGLDPAWLQQVILGLGAEWGNTPLDVLKVQEPFLSGMHYLTDWAKQRFPKQVVNAKIEEARGLLAILNE
jgi:hypothetical protein